MPPVWKAQPPKVYRQWVDACLLVKDKLTPWELSFCESISLALTRHKELTQHEAEKLEEIYANRTD